MKTITFLHRKQIVVGFLVLGERLSTEATRKKDARGFTENLGAAKEDGEVAGRARKDAEKTFGIDVVSLENSLDLAKKKKIGRK